MTPRIIILRTR